MRFADASLMTGPMVTPSSNGRPTTTFLVTSCTPSMTRSYTDRSTRRREGIEQPCPALLVNRADGVIGSSTELRVSRGSTLAFTDDTGTAREYRGLGLAKAVKAESLRRLRDDHPLADLVTTSNAEENAVMRHVNTWLGFAPSVVETTAALKL